jgi:predicted RNA-binding Zn-ribbon protein involved in translation (DUF1610 family)
MIGRFCDISTHPRYDETGSDVERQKLTDYSCPVCGTREYHLIFRVEALTDRTTMLVECKLCRLRKELLTGTKAVA